MKFDNDKSKFKIEFKKRLYKITLELIEYIDKLPNDRVSNRLIRDDFNFLIVFLIFEI